MEKEEIIYSIKIDLEASNAALKEYAGTLTGVAKSQAEINQTTKDQLAISEREAKARQKTKEVIEAEAGSIAALREQNKKLTAERNSLSLATEEGRKRVAAINKELDTNNKVIKENVDAYTKQKIGIGDYSGAIDRLIPGLGATASSFKVVGKEMWALVANPIGATVTAIALAFGALMKYLTGSEEGQNRLNKAMAVGGALMEKVWDIVEGFGEAIFDAFTNPKQAIIDLVDMIKTNLINRFTALSVIMEGIVNLDFKKVANGVLQLGTGVEDVIGKTQRLAQEVTATFNEAITQGNRLAALQAQIDRDERASLVDRQRVHLEVLKLRAEAITQEGEARKATVKAAIALEEDLAAREETRAQRKLDLAKLQMQTNGDDKDALRAVAQAEADLLAAQASRYEATLRFQKEIERLNDEDRTKKQQQAEADLKFNQEMDDRAYAATQASLERDQKAREKARVEREKMDKEAAEKRKVIDQEVTNSLNKNLGSILQNQMINYKAGFELFKKGKLLELLTSTHTSAVNAMASASAIPLIGWLLGPLAYAEHYAKGISSYLLIQGTSLGFAQGGMVLSGTRIQSNHGTPIRRSNGDNLLATVKTGEVILNERHQAQLGGAATFKRIGVPGFAGSGYTGIPSAGFETKAAIASYDQERLIAKLDKLLDAPPQPVLVMQDYEYAQHNRDQPAQRARVIS